jgi:transcriptional regulator with XRE-family HTH domain
MYHFFRLIDDAGLKQRRVAALMNVSEAQFSLVKSGARAANDEFRRRAANALLLVGLRDPEGRAYTADDLFVPVPVNDRTDIVREVV